MAKSIKEIIAAIDHTNLDPLATEKDMFEFARVAQGSGVAALCVPPAFVETLVQHFPDGVPICTVVGFPNGYEASEIKSQAARYAWAHGAKEVDMVVPLGRVKGHDFDYVLREVQLVLNERPKGGILKVILETGALTDEEIVRTIEALNALDIDYYKTSTGFKYPGASIEAAEIIMIHKRPEIKLKVSGGIRTTSEAREYLELGASRIGASKLLAECLDAL